MRRQYSTAMPGFMLPQETELWSVFSMSHPCPAWSVNVLHHCLLCCQASTAWLGCSCHMMFFVAFWPGAPLVVPALVLYMLDCSGGEAVR